MKSTATPDVDDPYDATAKDVFDIDPAMASCHGRQRLTLDKYPPRRRVWFQKKWSDSKQAVEPQSNGRQVDDALLNSLVTIGISSATSSTSGSQTNEESTKSNRNSSESSGLNQSLEFEEEDAATEQDIRTTVSANYESNMTSCDDIVPRKKLLKSRRFPVNACTTLPHTMYHNEEFDVLRVHSKMPPGILDDRSVHSLDTLSTVTLDPVLLIPLSLQCDDPLEKIANNSSSFHRQLKYQNVKRLPLLQTFGNSSFSCDLSIWTNSAVGSDFHQGRMIQTKISDGDQRTKSLTGRVVSYITTTEATTASRMNRETTKTPLIITACPKKSVSILDQNKIEKNIRRNLRSYQCEPELSCVADAYLIEI